MFPVSITHIHPSSQYHFHYFHLFNSGYAAYTAADNPIFTFITLFAICTISTSGTNPHPSISCNCHYFHHFHNFQWDIQPTTYKPEPFSSFHHFHQIDELSCVNYQIGTIIKKKTLWTHSTAIPKTYFFLLNNFRGLQLFN